MDAFGRRLKFFVVYLYKKKKKTKNQMIKKNLPSLFFFFGGARGTELSQFFFFKYQIRFQFLFLSLRPTSKNISTFFFLIGTRS